MSKLDLHFDALTCLRLSPFAQLRIQKIQTHVIALEKKLAEHEKDITEAARSLAVPLPDPGSDLAKVIRINREINRLRVDERAVWTELNDNQVRLIYDLKEALEDRERHR